MSLADGLHPGHQPHAVGQPPTRERLIAAFTHLVQQRGFAAVGTAEILEAAAAPRGSLYHHFPTGKSGLAVAAVETLADDIVDTLQRSARSRRSLPDLLRRMADARAAWLRRTKWSAGPLMTVLANEAVPHEPNIAEALKREGEAINRAFTDLFAARGFPPEQAARNGRLARSMLDGATTLCRAVRSDEALRETGDFLATHLAAPEHDGA